MKNLFIIRHAKSSWDNPLLPDFERPLNSRGKKSVIAMGNFLKNKPEKFDFAISSPALRAITTAGGICKIIGYPVENISVEPTIYHASTMVLFKAISQISDAYETAAVFGHNPGLTDLYNYLTGDYLGNLSTCGIAKISFDIDSWAEISAERGKPIYIETPKMQGIDNED